MFRLRSYLKYIIVIILLIILGFILFLFYYNKIDYKKVENKKEDIVKEEIKKEEKKEEEKKYLYVDIKGAVNKPGVYKLEEDKRVIDVINLSGGLRDDADTSIINLSKKLTDEMLIIIYTKDQINNYKNEISISKINEVITKNKIVLNKENKAEAFVSNENVQKEENETDKIININTCTKEDILSLPGIGESKADAIIQYRKENGNFNSIEEIKNVSGIGDALFEKIKEFITV